MKLFIISGRSGSGKSTILQALEDQGYQCIDNLPVTLLHNLVEENLRSASLLLAVCIDARSQSLQTFPEILKALPLDKSARRVVYLDAVSPTLVKRFSETRRRHPLTLQTLICWFDLLVLNTAFPLTLTLSLICAVFLILTGTLNCAHCQDSINL